MKITLVRHAEVQEAYHGCYNGHIDIALSQKGEAQAKALALGFARKDFDAVFSSDLKRCKETLDAFSLSVAPLYTQALREKSWGRHEGMSFEQIIANEAFVYEDFEQWISALDGEAYCEYIERIRTFFYDYLPRQPYENVLVMTHAGVIRILMHLVQNISLEEAFSRSFGYAGTISLDTQTWAFKETACA